MLLLSIFLYKKTYGFGSDPLIITHFTSKPKPLHLHYAAIRSALDGLTKNINKYDRT